MKQLCIYIYIYRTGVIHTHIYIYIYIYIHTCVQHTKAKGARGTSRITISTLRNTAAGLHNKIPAHKIFARVWVAQESLCFIGSG